MPINSHYLSCCIRWEDSISFELDDILNEKFPNALREENKSRHNHFLEANLFISEDNGENSENEFLAKNNTDITSSKATCDTNYDMTSSEFAIKNDEGLYEMKLNPFNEANSPKESAFCFR